MDALIRSRLADGLNYYKSGNLTLEQTLDGFEGILKESIPLESQVDVKIAPQFTYDKEADVMYISFGKPMPSSSEDYKEIVIRRNADKLNGITIINYSKKLSNFSD